MQETNIANLHDAIKTSYAAKFTECTVDYYPRPGEKIVTPAILIDVESFDVLTPDDLGTGQLSLMVNIKAYCVLSYKQGSKKALRVLAGRVLHHAHRNRWGLQIGAAEVEGAQPDLMEGESEAYEVMRCEFSNAIALGEDEIEKYLTEDENGNPLVTPDHVYFGDAPNIGPGNEEDYQEITNCGCGS
jgi:hypothetical protein